MRKKLKSINGKRTRFAGVVDRLGTKRGWTGDALPTVLLKNIYMVSDSGNILTDHLWMNVGKQLENVEIGDVVEFDARVTPYEKGYRGYDSYLDTTIDYRLERPTKVVFFKNNGD